MLCGDKYQRRHGLKKLEGQKSQFSDRQLQISDREHDHGCSKLKVCPSHKMGIFSLKFSIFGRKFSDKKIPTDYMLSLPLLQALLRRRH